jgi:transglutaminase-like putative cysteine protease
MRLNLPSAASIIARVHEMTDRIRSQVSSNRTGNVTQRVTINGKTVENSNSSSCNQFMQSYNSDSFSPAPNKAPPVSGVGDTAPSNSNANPEQVAQQIAQRAAGWNYDNTGGKTWTQSVNNENTFDGSGSGVCADMALEAAQEFEKAGVEARVVYGNTAQGNHAWVEFKDSSGNWQMFDPTAAACSKDPNAAITPKDNGLYNYGSAFELHDAPPER